MNLSDKIYDTIKSMAKAVMHSRKGLPFKGIRHDSIIIMGNGPSLNDLIEKKLPLLKENTTMAVNFAALSEAFFSIKPACYVLADPHFFSNPEPGSNLYTLREAFRRIDWPITLYIPVGADARPYMRPTVSIRRINADGIECHLTLALRLPPRHRHAAPAQCAHTGHNDSYRRRIRKNIYSGCRPFVDENNISDRR